MMSEPRTTVVNVRVQHIRPAYSDLKEWCADCNNIYIGRRGVVFVGAERFPIRDSLWANPFKLPPKSGEADREACIAKYRAYIIEKIRAEGLEEELEKLRGKNLGCWCHPQLCHGHVLLELLGKKR